MSYDSIFGDSSRRQRDPLPASSAFPISVRRVVTELRPLAGVVAVEELDPVLVGSRAELSEFILPRRCVSYLVANDSDLIALGGFESAWGQILAEVPDVHGRLHTIRLFDAARDSVDA